MAERKKQIALRLSPKLYAEIAAWAEEDFRSINGQIEYLLTECVRQRKKPVAIYLIVFQKKYTLEKKSTLYVLKTKQGVFS